MSYYCALVATDHLSYYGVCDDSTIIFLCTRLVSDYLDVTSYELALVCYSLMTSIMSFRWCLLLMVG